MGLFCSTAERCSANIDPPANTGAARFSIGAHNVVAARPVSQADQEETDDEESFSAVREFHRGAQDQMASDPSVALLPYDGEIEESARSCITEGSSSIRGQQRHRQHSAECEWGDYAIDDERENSRASTLQQTLCTSVSKNNNYSDSAAVFRSLKLQHNFMPSVNSQLSLKSGRMSSEHYTVLHETLLGNSESPS